MTNATSTLVSSPADWQATPLTLRFRGPAAALSAVERRALFDRGLAGHASEIRSRTSDIIDRIRRDGDGALIALAREYDCVSMTELEVPRASRVHALEALEPGLRRALERSANNIACVHQAFLPKACEASPEPGIVIGRRPDPLTRVGVYAPGGRASYPSSVLMGVIPARLAGVREIVLCSPPRENGLPAPVLLAAAELAGVDRVFAVGGAGAIAAMALGTETIPRVDRVVGPGNAYVAEAKLQLTGVVGIDVPAGPSELLVIADETSDPEVVARELIAQAEHDPLACAVAITLDDRTAAAVELALARQLASAPRREIIARAIAGQGGILTVADADAALELVNRYAPEHLLIAFASAERCAAMLADIRNAGTVFLGETTSNAFGDYMSGANHVLPTGGLARTYSGLSTSDFVRWTTYQRIDRGAAGRLAPDVERFALAEGLPGHASAARAWSASVESSGFAAPNAHTLVRVEIAALSLYSEARDDCDSDNDAELVDLSDNTNLWGSPPAARDTVGERDSNMARYPSPYSADLKRALGEYVGVPPDNIVTGCGSDDILCAAMRAFAVPGDTIVYSTPTFSMIPVFARVNGLVPIELPLRDADGAYDIDPDRLAKRGAKIIYLCGPNNPTGTPISRDAILRVIDNAGALIILDEAYAEFAEVSHVDLVARCERLLVTRTLSKAFGLAGLRVGYGVAAPSLTSFLERARGPYRIAAASERCALAALEERPEALGWMREHVRLARESRDRFLSELRRLGLEPLPSDANFVLLPHPEAASIGAHLRRGGVLVRVLSRLPISIRALANANGNALRIGVAPWSIMRQTLDLLAAAIA